MSSNICFPKVIADAFPFRHFVDTHTSDKQTVKTSTFAKVIWLATFGCDFPFYVMFCQFNCENSIFEISLKVTFQNMDTITKGSRILS